MSIARKILMGSGGKKDSTYVDDVFSTYLYVGNQTPRTITNNIDLTEGGLVWTKRRSGCKRTCRNGPRYWNWIRWSDDQHRHLWGTR